MTMNRICDLIELPIIGFSLALSLLVPVDVAEARGFQVLYAFQGGSDGNTPRANLIADKNGNLYGTSTIGGEYGYGTVFEIAPDGAETVLHSFESDGDGAVPYGGVISDKSGNLYGTTGSGGSFGYGTVFKLAPD